MTTEITLFHPDAGARGGSSAPDATPSTYTLPPDLLEQVRGRVKLLAILLFGAFGFDLLHALVQITLHVLGHLPLLAGDIPKAGFLAMDAGCAAASLGMWWLARDRRVSPTRLLSLGLFYEVAICFAVAFISTWSYALEYGHAPNLTWVPLVVVLFPLVLPGPPRRMLGAAIVSGAMAPLALILHAWRGHMPVTGDDITRTAVASAFAVVFAYTGARIVYRLGRDVAAAREMGSYRLEAMLGRGGMGEVWRARHRMLARPAAIKLIRRELVGRDAGDGGLAAVQRFEREAQVIAGLRSPHTIELFDFGSAADGTIYYVMELLDGVDVHTLVKRFGPVPPARAIRIVRQICHSLSEAHARGVVHRDIKPANVFLCRYGEEVDFVKVLDFGLAKEAEPRAEGRTALTGERSIPGTPAFLAPEQAMGKGPLDGRVDLYATGCVAYWLLTGTTVFTADSPIEQIVKHTQEAPAPPSTRTEMPIPPTLDRLILACLAKEPADRPPSARALSDALAAVEGAGDWSEERAQEWWRAHLPAPVPGPPSPSPPGVTRA
jgi:hypothetical protein